MKAIRRNLRISPKKVNLVASLVRGKPAEQALNFLRFTPKKSARPLYDTLKSAVANAEQNFKQDKKDLYVSKIIVNEGSTLKRHMPVSRGRAHPILKRTSHITIEVAVRTDSVTAPKKVIKTVKESAEKTEEQSNVSTEKAKKTTKAKSIKSKK